MTDKKELSNNLQDSLANCIFGDVKFGMTKEELIHTESLSTGEVKEDEIIMNWDKSKLLSNTEGLSITPSYKVELERKDNVEIASKGIISFYSDYEDFAKFQKNLNKFVQQYSDTYGEAIHILDNIDELSILDLDGTSKWEQKDLAVWAIGMPGQPGKSKFINIRGYRYEHPMSYVCEIEIWRDVE